MTMSNRLTRAALALGALALPTQALAQLDPLLFLKTTQPYVILAVDAAQRMQVDADGTYYDPGLYTKTGAAHEPVLGLQPSEAAKSYRRKYAGLSHNAGVNKFLAARIDAVGDLEAEYATFFEPTRLAIARRGLIRALTDNQTSALFGLVRMRQNNATLPAAGNDLPVLVSDLTQQAPTDVAVGTWKITRTTVTTSNSTHATSGLLTSASATGANTTILTTLGKDIGSAGALLPAGIDGPAIVDAPVGLLLDDARAHAASLISADAAAGGCRNTIVVLVTGGGEGTIGAQDLAAKASTFLSVNGRRVPIYVIALFPPAGDVATLKKIAANSGGQYFEVTAAMVAATTAGSPVPEAVRGVNTAVQHAFASQTTFNTAPTTALPFGPYEEHQTTSPIVGTVNLRGATKIGSSGLPEALPDSETYIFKDSTPIPQRSNVMVTSGFVLPSFDARLRAFRVYKPVADATRPTGYKFVQDGSRLWVSSTPAEGSRNLFTVLPGSSTLVPFDAANLASFSKYLRVSDPSDLVTYIRRMPLGAVVGSTPAFLAPPSLDPPPDTDYPGFADANKDRRALIFVGGSDGMLHALDARSGLEVWAFIPFNLLPKLRALRSGQPLDAFNYFVDSSPKLSDVKVAGKWRTYLFFGQGPGGTFYNTLDVTLDDIRDSVSETSSDSAALLTYFAKPDRIEWEWSFPRNTSFDYSLDSYGELSASDATATEQTVGETWSDPAIGQFQNETGPYIMITGSGFLRYTTQNTYRKAATRSGTTLYVLDVATGAVLGTPRDVGADGTAETVNDCRAANDCTKIKNALQMDPIATGVSDQRFITKAYIGDLDGRVWRFDLSMSGSTVVVSTGTKLYDAGAAHPLFSSMATVNVGGTNQYIFVGTGSDLLPSNGVNQSYSLLVLLETGGSTASKTAGVLLEKTDWPAAAGGDEKVTAFPAVAGDIVFFSTTTYNPTTSCTPFNANLYGFTFIGGPAYDTNGDGSITTESSGKGKKGGGSSGDSQKVFTQANRRATAPFVVDQHLVFAAGGEIQMFGDPEDFNNGVGQAGVRILSWRMVK